MGDGAVAALVGEGLLLLLSLPVVEWVEQADGVGECFDFGFDFLEEVKEEEAEEVLGTGACPGWTLSIRLVREETR